jgi:hypothetical protein
MNCLRDYVNTAIKESDDNTSISRVRQKAESDIKVWISSRYHDRIGFDLHHVLRIRRMIVITKVARNARETPRATFSSLLWLIPILVLPMYGEIPSVSINNMKVLKASQRLKSPKVKGKEGDIISFLLDYKTMLL